MHNLSTEHTHDNDGVHPNKKRRHLFFHNIFHECARIFEIFGMQLWKWILIIPVNLPH